MKAIIVLLLSNVLFLAVSVAKNTEAEDADRASIINNVHAMWKAIETNNLKDYMQYIHTDYTLFGESDAYLHKGKDKEAIDI